MSVRTMLTGHVLSRMWFVAVVLFSFAQTAYGDIPFARHDLPCSAAQLRFADVNGDGFYDVLSLRDTHLLVFLHNKSGGFSAKPDIDYPLGDKLSIVWPQTVRKTSRDEIFVLDGEGVSRLSYSLREANLLPTKRIAIRNILSDNRGKDAIFFPLAVDTAMAMPAILIPMRDAVEVWMPTTSDDWKLASRLDVKPSGWAYAMTDDNAYQQSLSMNLSVGDCNGDGRGDLVFRKWLPEDEKQIFKVFLQSSDGRFSERPTNELVVNNTFFADWLCLQDINRDGVPDLIQNTWTREPWLPGGIVSGKVIVRVFLADAAGKIPSQPSFLFRKNDWQNAVPIVDLDGDGRMDLVLGYYHWGGRDDVVRILETKRVDLELRIHFFGNGGYRPAPDLSVPVRVYFENPGIGLDFSWTDLFHDAIRMEGDFNADGCKDLLYRSGKDEVSVRFMQGRTQGFSPKADLVFRVPMDRRVKFLAKDINRDKISDLIVLPEDRAKPVTIFMSRRAKK